jgi:sigma-B regulation protein RsbU (phosphoserine phosphatase)
MVSGIMSGVEMGSTTMELQLGDTLVLYTDGVTEAFDAAGAMFEEKGLLACLCNATGQPAAETASMVLAAVRHHAGDHPQSDDITVVTVRRTR